MPAHRYNLKVRLFRPQSASLLQRFTSWLAGMAPEFSDPRFPSYGEGREGEGPEPGSPCCAEELRACIAYDAWLQPAA